MPVIAQTTGTFSAEQHSGNSAGTMRDAISTSIVREILASGFMPYPQGKQLQSGDMPAVRENLETALEYNPFNSDAYYLLAYLDYSQSAIASAANRLALALTTDTWTFTEPYDAYRLYFTVSLLANRAGMINENYADNRAWARFQPFPHLLVLLAEAAYRSGNVTTAGEITAYGKRMYPDDGRFTALNIVFHPRILITDYPWLSTHLSAYSARDFDTLELTTPGTYGYYLVRAGIIYASQMESGESRRMLLDLLPSDDAFADVLASLRISDLAYDEIADYAASMAADGNVPGYYLVTSLGRGVFTDVQQRDDAMAGIFSSLDALSIDAAMDGRSEIELQYSSGVLGRLVVDSDQDGSPEEIIEFSPDPQAVVIPSAVEFHQGDSVLRLEYRAYPRVFTASLTHRTPGKTEVREYYLGEESFLYPVVTYSRSGMYAQDGENEFLSRMMAGLLAGRLGMGDIPLYISSDFEEVLHLEEINIQTAGVEMLIASMTPYIFLSTTRLENESGYGRAEQSRYYSGRIAAIREDENADGRYESYLLYSDGHLEYRLTLTGDDQYYYARYGLDGGTIEEHILSRSRLAELPPIVRSVLQTGMWSIPE